MSAIALAILSYIGPKVGVKLVTWLAPMLFNALKSRAGANAPQVLTLDQVKELLATHAREVPAVDPKP